LRHKVEIYNLTGRVLECPIDELNRPRGGAEAKLRIPPTTTEVDQLFAGWREELGSCRKFAPTARNYAAARLMAEVGLRVNEACRLDLHDVKWDLGRFGKLHVRHGRSVCSRCWSPRWPCASSSTGPWHIPRTRPPPERHAPLSSGSASGSTLAYR
jgi:hypothetical protein